MRHRADASEDLLYGLLALQNGRNSTVCADRRPSVLDGGQGKADGRRAGRPGCFDAPQRVLLAALVDAHLKLHGGDAQRSLAVISPGRSTFASLEALGNDEINASLGHIRGALHVTCGAVGTRREHPQLRGRLLHERRPQVPRPAASCVCGCSGRCLWRSTPN